MRAALIRSRAWLVITACLGVLLGAGFLAPAIAHAASDYNGQFCTSSTREACINAHDGGPFVDVYENTNTYDNSFSAYPVPGSNDWGIDFVGGGSWDGKCVGDAYNLAGGSENGVPAYETSLDTCPNGGSGAGWGTNFGIATTSTQISFYNIHWGGWLCPSDNYASGSPFILDSGYQCWFNIYDYY